MDKYGGLVSKTAVLLTEWSSGGDLVSKSRVLLTEWGILEHLVSKSGILLTEFRRGVATALAARGGSHASAEQEAQGVSPLPPSKHLVRGRQSTLRPRSLERPGRKALALVMARAVARSGVGRFVVANRNRAS